MTSPPSALGGIVVGTGFGVLTHARAMRKAGIEVRALVGRDPERTADRAARSGIPFATTSLTEALALPDVGIVAVSTPPYTHTAIALEAIAARKHVVCEKPFARDADEARTMLAAADAAGVVHALGTEFRFAAGQAQLTRTIRSAAIGVPRHATFMLQMPTLTDPSAGMPAWWIDNEQGGGWLGAYGSHIIDQIRVTLGEFTRVSARLRTLAPLAGMTANDSYDVQFELANGCIGIMSSSCAMGGDFVAATKVVGSTGTAWLRGEEVWLDAGSGPVQVPSPTDLPFEAPEPPPAEFLHTTYDMWHSMGIDLAPYSRLYRRVGDLALGRTVDDDPPLATFADGLAAQLVFDAIHQSSRENRWIDIV